MSSRSQGETELSLKTTEFGDGGVIAAILVAAAVSSATRAAKTRSTATTVDARSSFPAARLRQAPHPTKGDLE